MFESDFSSPVADTSGSIDFGSPAEAVDPQAINLTSSQPAAITNLPLETTDNRASKAHFAMGQSSPGLDMLRSTFAAGGEWDTRQRFAEQKDQEKYWQNKDLIDRVAFNGQPLGGADTDFMTKVLKTKPVDPETVLEKEFSKQFVTFGTTIRPDVNQTFSRGWMQFPAETAFEQHIATELNTKKNLATSIREEFEAKWQKMPWLHSDTPNPSSPVALNAQGAADAYAMTLIPLISWANMHNALAKSEGLMPGTNMANQIRDHWRIPDTDQFAKTLRASAEAMWAKNPLDALTMLRSAEMFSDSDELLGNVFGWADIASVVPIGALFNGAKLGSSLLKGKLTGGALTATEGASKVINVDPRLTNFYNFDGQTVGPHSNLLPQDVRDKGREILSNQGTFTTARGSSYTVHGDGTTTRVSAEDATHPGGPKDRSKKTVYVANEDADKALNSRGNLTGVETFNQPSVGRSPVEYWDGKYHVGSPITEVTPKEAGPVMQAKRGPVMNAQKGFTMQTERGPTSDVIPPTVRDVINDVRGMDIPLRGPTSPSRLPQLEEDTSRQQFVDAWARYYQRRPWQAPSDVNPDGTFPAALLPKTPYADRGPSPDRYEEMMQGIRQGMGDVVKASGTKKVDPEVVFNWFGDIETAARIGITRIDKAVTELRETGQIKSQPPTTEGLYELGKDLPSSLNPTGQLRNPVALSRARATGFWRMLENSMGVERLPQEALDRAYKNAADDIKLEFHTFEDHIVDVIQNDRDPFTNTRSSTTLFGNRGKLPFETPEQALTFAKIMGLNEERYIISPAQTGIGHFIAITKPLDETASSVRGLRVETQFSQIPANRWSNLIFGTWNPRTAEDLLSRFIQEGAHTATHSPQNLRAFFKGIIDESITPLSKTDRAAVQDVLRANRDYEANGKRGQFADTEGEFAVMFQRQHGHLPTEGQTNAYFSFIQLNDMDWVIRNLGVLRDKRIKGIEEHRFALGEGKTPWLEGKIVDRYPLETSEDSGLMIINRANEVHQYMRRQSGEFDSKRINKMMNEEGYSLIQLAEPHTRPLMKLTGEKDTVNFVLVNTRETRPLPWKQMEYQPGGHVVYANNWWVKQAQISLGRDGKAFYYGDTNLFNFSSEKEAKFWTDRYETARKILNTGDEAALDRYVTNNLPHSPAEFKKLFKDHLDPEQPLSHAQSGYNTVRTNPEYYKNTYKDVGGLRNDVDSQFNLYQGIDKTFLADRDYQLGTIAGNGDVLKPWKIERATAVEPFNALNNALGQAMRARYMNDYKIAAAESWLQQFGHILQGGERESFYRNPIAALFNAPIKRVAENASREQVLAAENARNRIIDFIGVKSEFDSNLNRIQNMVADAAYGSRGHKGADWVSSTILPWLKDPTEYTRAIAFHSHLGLFNPVQLWVQAQTMANAIAIGGVKNGVNGAVMAFMQHYLAHTEDIKIIEHFANMAEKISLGRVKAEHFLESYQAMKDAGIWHVGGETAWRDSVMDPKLYDGTIGKWLDKGTIFFNAGERQARLAAWNTAYLEWRVANKEATLDNKAMNTILARSDTFSGNMTRASNSNWQKGITSVPLQFTAYTARMFEQMTISGRLTLADKVRAFTTYSALYGVPVALGATTGLDMYTDIRKAALERGVDLSDKYQVAMREGIPSLMFSIATGKDYDWAKRMGPNGSSLIDDAWSGKKSIDEVFGGASYQTIKDIIKSTRPFTTWAYQTVIKGDPSASPLLWEDWAGVAANSSTTWSNTMKMMYGLTAGQYITKNNVKVTGIDTMDSLMMPLFGVKPMKVETVFEKADVIKERTKAQEQFQQEALTEYRRGVDRMAKYGDAEGLNQHMKKAHIILDSAQLNQTQKSLFWDRAMKGETKTMGDKINQDWILKAPAEFQKQRIDNKVKQ